MVKGIEHDFIELDVARKGLCFCESQFLQGILQGLCVATRGVFNDDIDPFTGTEGWLNMVLMDFVWYRCEGVRFCVAGRLDIWRGF